MYTKLTSAQIKLTGGHGVVKHAEEAATLFEIAANQAVNQRRGKHAALLFEKAENAWALCE